MMNSKSKKYTHLSSDFYDEKPFRLDVLVCGRCHSAFHLFDAFRSHSKTCDGDESNAECADDSAEAVAMVIWCNTIRRKIEEQGQTAGEKLIT